MIATLPANPMGNIEIRHATIGDAERLQAFMRKAYLHQSRWKHEARWRWQFVQNPEADVDRDLPTVIALDGEEVIGQMAVEPACAWVDGQAVRAGWKLDFFVLPEYRGRGLGQLMVKPIAESSLLSLALTMAPASREILRRSGAVELGPVSQYCRFGRVSSADVIRYVNSKASRGRGARAIIATLLRTRLGSSLSAGILRTVFGVQWLIARRSVRGFGNIELQKVERFGHEYDELADRLRATHAFCVGRGSRWMTWRFLDCPDMNYSVVEARAKGKLVGYVAYRSYRREELRGGAIVDLVVEPGAERVAAILASHAIASMGDCAFVEAGASAPWLCRVFRSLGFMRRGRHWPTAIASDPELRSRVLRSARSTFLTKADQDWDQIRAIDP